MGVVRFRLPFPAPVVQISRMIERNAVRLHNKRHAVICRTQRCHLNAALGLHVPASHPEDMYILWHAPDILSDKIKRIRTIFHPSEYRWIEMIGMMMGNKYRKSLTGICFGMKYTVSKCSTLWRVVPNTVEQ